MAGTPAPVARSNSCAVTRTFSGVGKPVIRFFSAATTAVACLRPGDTAKPFQRSSSGPKAMAVAAPRPQTQVTRFTTFARPAPRRSPRRSPSSSSRSALSSDEETTGSYVLRKAGDRRKSDSRGLDSQTQKEYRQSADASDIISPARTSADTVALDSDDLAVRSEGMTADAQSSHMREEKLLPKEQLRHSNEDRLSQLWRESYTPEELRREEERLQKLLEARRLELDLHLKSWEDNFIELRGICVAAQDEDRRLRVRRAELRGRLEALRAYEASDFEAEETALEAESQEISKRLHDEGIRLQRLRAAAVSLRRAELATTCLGSAPLSPQRAKGVQDGFLRPGSAPLALESC